MMHRKLGWVAIALPVIVATNAFAAVTAEEAAQLKDKLTPLGAERAGNADGTIPAWDGGYTTVPEGFDSGMVRPDPFADEKPLFSITAGTMEQYAENLSDGDKELFKRYPSYRIDVYPTHRTHAAPQWVYDNTFANATRAETRKGGNTVAGAYGGIPFPIPQTGHEVMWNHLLAWQGQSAFFNFSAWVVTADGERVLATEADQQLQYPFYDPDGDAESWNGDYFWLKQVATGPSYKVGEAILVHDSADADTSRQSWQYLTGQRRVRKAPTIAYDTPDFVMSGVGNFDEAFVFLGALDRYDWKIVGKKELYVPYNNNRFASLPVEDVLGPDHLNPDAVRYELHRVWVVEGTLAEGKRHVVPKRRYYIDEDSWRALAGDSWDAQGNLWKHYYGLTLLAPEVPAVVGTMQWGLYNFQSGSYVLNNSLNTSTVHYRPTRMLSPLDFTPDALAGDALR